MKLSINITTTTEGYIICLTKSVDYNIQDHFVVAKGTDTPKVFALIAGQQGALKAVDVLCAALQVGMVEDIFLDGSRFLRANAIHRSVFE